MNPPNLTDPLRASLGGKYRLHEMNYLDPETLQPVAKFRFGAHLSTHTCSDIKRPSSVSVPGEQNSAARLAPGGVKVPPKPCPPPPPPSPKPRPGPKLGDLKSVPGPELAVLDQYPAPKLAPPKPCPPPPPPSPKPRPGPKLEDLKSIPGLELAVLDQPPAPKLLPPKPCPPPPPPSPKPRPGPKLAILTQCLEPELEDLKSILDSKFPIPGQRPLPSFSSLESFKAPVFQCPDPCPDPPPPPPPPPSPAEKGGEVHPGSAWEREKERFRKGE